MDGVVGIALHNRNNKTEDGIFWMASLSFSRFIIIVVLVVVLVFVTIVKVAVAGWLLLLCHSFG